jgi:demethylmenaquinone methyltransferase/2-methoxy-6-polyprenyl-1,4-benzoquinol methylase
MSSFVWMKILESAPWRYDRGVRRLSRGRIDGVYRRIAERVAAPGRAILDIGCGTGGVSLACAARGADVFGIDRDAGMLQVARAKPVPGEGTVTWIELAAAEIEDRFAEESLDAVVSCLAFSELSPQQRAYALKIARTRLRPGGELLVADEVTPRSRVRRAWYHLRRVPLTALTYLLTQTTTRPVDGLTDAVRAAGFAQVEETRTWEDSFVLVHATRAEAGGAVTPPRAEADA